MVPSGQGKPQWKQGIDIGKEEPTLAALEQQTKPEKVLRQIEKTVEKGCGHPPADGCSPRGR